MFCWRFYLWPPASTLTQIAKPSQPSSPGARTVSLNGPWRLSYGLFDKSAPQTPAELKASNWPQIPATVPGNVELDLLAAGIIKNPETGNNVNDLRKYEAYQWWYSRTFDTPKLAPGERAEIVFEGLDCLGTVWVNDKPVGKTDNMLIAHRFDVTEALSPAGAGPNTIHVRIDPAVLEGRKYLTGVLVTRHDTGAEAVNIRKAPHMYGWDIMPRLVSAGLWRDVYLNILRPTRLRQVYWMTNSVNLPARTAQLILDWDLVSDLPTIDGLAAEVSLQRGGRPVYEKTIALYTFTSRQVIDLADVEFWWPRGYGDPALYEGTVRIVDAQKRVLDERTGKFGIRTAELVSTDITTPEQPGEFVFKVNGEKIFVRGTNWVPLDGLHSRDLSHVEAALEMIADLNCNMIRCWGGNVYESDEFYRTVRCRRRHGLAGLRHGLLGLSAEHRVRREDQDRGDPGRAPAPPASVARPVVGEQRERLRVQPAVQQAVRPRPGHHQPPGPAARRLGVRPPPALPSELALLQPGVHQAGERPPRCCRRSTCGARAATTRRPSTPTSTRTL